MPTFDPQRTVLLPSSIVLRREYAAETSTPSVSSAKVSEINAARRGPPFLERSLYEYCADPARLKPRWSKGWAVVRSTVAPSEPSSCAASALFASLRASEIYQDVSHKLRRKPEEMCAVLPLDIFPIDQPHVGFVYQRSGLEDVAGALRGHVAAGYSVQFRVDQWGELLQRHPITAVPGDEQLCDLVG